MRRVLIAAAGLISVLSGTAAVGMTQVVAHNPVGFVCRIEGDPDGLLCHVIYTAASVVCTPKHPCG